MSDEKKTVNKKIMLMGLENSGKTTILLNLKKGTNIMSLYSMIPTHGLHVVNFREEDTNFYIWDFGGQKKYRHDYVEKLDEYTLEVDEIFFVIDIQDTERYPTALEYLKEIAVGLKKLKKPHIQLSIFLHKYSPDLRNDKRFSPENIKKNLLIKIQEILSPDIEWRVFKTRVYTALEKIPLPL
ncbi:MAG: ADP-ribosylation factor-like protein [Candidatus Helarchaeota archaeon]